MAEVPEAVALILVEHTGDTFSAGADLGEIAPALVSKGKPSEAATLVAIRSLLAAIERAPQPVVALVDGRCLAGGLELALACDLIAATPQGTFFDAHLAGGLLPSGGAAVRLSERLGPGRAFRLLVEGCRLNAEEALEWGLIDVLHQDPDRAMDWARELARRLASYPPGLVRRMTAQIRAAKLSRQNRRFGEELAELDAYAARNRSALRERLARFLEAP